MPFAKNEKQRYVESYKSGSRRFRDEKLPVLNHVTIPFELVEAHMLKAGVVERDGETLEFQEIRLYLKEKING